MTTNREEDAINALNLSQQEEELVSVKRKPLHKMTLREVVDEINSLIGTLNRYQPIEGPQDCRNFGKFGIWYAVKNVEMVNGHPSNYPRCIFHCITIPDATEVDVLVGQVNEEDEEFSSFAHSYLVTLRCMLQDFKRREQNPEPQF